METVSASVVCENDMYFIRIAMPGHAINIPISEDKPNDVKAAFNKLISRCKNGEFKIQLDKAEENLFSQVSNEYLKQLNQEIQEVRSEMVKFGLI
jgi:hypothetical protein